MNKNFAIVSYNTDLAFFAAYIIVGERRIFLVETASKLSWFRSLEVNLNSSWKTMIQVLNA